MSGGLSPKRSLQPTMLPASRQAHDTRRAAARSPPSRCSSTSTRMCSNGLLQAPYGNGGGWCRSAAAPPPTVRCPAAGRRRLRSLLERASGIIALLQGVYSAATAKGLVRRWRCGELGLRPVQLQPSGPGLTRG
jgi:hypothetical protein